VYPISGSFDFEDELFIFVSFASSFPRFLNEHHFALNFFAFLLLTLGLGSSETMPSPSADLHFYPVL